MRLQQTILSRPFLRLLKTMQAVRLHPSPDPAKPYSAINPAPSTALALDSNVPIPELLGSGEILVKLCATTIVRDALTWPETYEEEFKILGNDFAGTVVTVNETDGHSSFTEGDEVYGMTEASRAGTWAEYAVVLPEEVCLKPKSLTWSQAAAVPLSGLTAYQALFKHAGFTAPNPLQQTSSLQKETVLLVTGASGGVGLYLVQLAKLAGVTVVAATRSNARNEQLLEQLGADEVVEYGDLTSHSNRYQIIIDTVGGDILKSCWALIKDSGTIVSVDSASYDFVREHQQLSLSQGRQNVKALFFIVESSAQDLEQLSHALDLGLIKTFVACEMPLANARSAYEQAYKPPSARGKIVLTI